MPGFLAANGGTAARRVQCPHDRHGHRQRIFQHSHDLPTGGELRAVLVPIPEPSTWAMLLLGFGAVGIVLRRSRRPARVTA